jgi:carboxypeptidase D
MDRLSGHASTPNVTFDVGRNWAGNIAVDRPGFPNDTLFFWAFEREKGSLTANAGERESEPWGIWLNGGYVASLLDETIMMNDPRILVPGIPV